MTYRALLPLLLAGCSLVDQARDDKLEVLSDTDTTTTGDEPGDSSPMPTTGTTTGEEETGDPSSGGALDIGRPPTIVDFFAPVSVNAAGPLVIDAEIIGATKTELVLERDGQEVERVKNPTLPWELPITSEKTFDGNYAVTLRAWSSTGGMSEKHADTTIDLPTGGTLRAEWQEPGVIPSTAAAVVPIVAGDLAVEDGALVAISIGGELWLQRFDVNLQPQGVVQPHCGDGICAWAPSAMVDDPQDPDRVYVVGNDFNGQAWVMCFTINGQPVWPAALELPNGHASGVAVDTVFPDRLFVSGWRELDLQGSNARMWIVQAADVTGEFEYKSSYQQMGITYPSRNRANDVAIVDDRVILVGATEIKNPNQFEPHGLRRGNVLEYENFALKEKFQIPSWDAWARSEFFACAPTPFGVDVVGTYFATGDNPSPLLVEFADTLEPTAADFEEVTGSYVAATRHPEHTIVVGEFFPTAAGSFPLWNTPYSSGSPFSRARGVAADRFGRLFIVGERIEGNETRGFVEQINP